MKRISAISVIDAALLRPLPYPQPDRIVLLYGRLPSGETSTLGPATFLDFRRQSHAFEHLSAFLESPFNLAGRDRPELIQGAVVTPNFFLVMGVPAFRGRTLADQHDGPGLARNKDRPPRISPLSVERSGVKPGLEFFISVKPGTATRPQPDLSPVSRPRPDCQDSADTPLAGNPLRTASHGSGALPPQSRLLWACSTIAV